MKPNVSDPEFCPHCKADLKGDPIRPESQHFYGGATHFKREMGYEFPEKYDGVWYYECPDCKGQFGGRKAVMESLDDR